MISRLLSLFAAVLFIAIPSNAMAARLGVFISSHEKLSFVSTTEFENDFGALSLCQLQTTTKIFFVNVWRSADGYGLANYQCDASSVIPLTLAEFQQAQSEGGIPSEISSEPKLSTGAFLAGIWGLLVVGGILAVGIVGAINTSRRRKKRLALMGDLSPANKALLDAMCHAAKTDGSIDPSEVEEIKTIAQEISGDTFTVELISEIAGLAESFLSDFGFENMVKDRTEQEMQDMMRGVMRVAAADGELDGKEEEFVKGLANAMGLSAAQVDTILNEVTEAISA